MTKALLVLFGLLVPFFSTATIFTDGTVPTSPPKLINVYQFLCIASDASQYTITLETNDSTLAAETCFNSHSDGYIEITASNHCASNNDTVQNTSDYYEHVNTSNYSTSKFWFNCNGSSGGISSFFTTSYFQLAINSAQCPNDTHITHTYPIHYDDVDSIVDACADPNQIPLLDSCNINDSPNVTVTAQDACYTKADGSQCNVAAVDVGGGNQVYMGSEGNCYTDPLPDVTNNPDLGGVPVGPDCVPSGSLLACPEDPTNVCVDSGSSFGGASTNNCQAGCGYINDSFVCIDSDTDSDGLPDYNDPDIDGDGVSNGNDIDADGDGKDDPIYSNVGGGGVGGSALDLKPVVDELKKLNEQFKVTPVNDFNSGGELDALNSDYNAEIKGFKDKTAAQLGFQDTLTLSNSSSLTNSIPVEQCQNYSIPVGFFGEFSLDTCSLSSKVQPLLTWFFGLLTAWYIFFTINRTLSEGF